MTESEEAVDRLHFKKPSITKYWNSKDEKYEYKISLLVSGIPTMRTAEGLSDRVLAFVTEQDGQTTFTK